MARVVKKTKREANYRPARMGAKRVCGNCEYYTPYGFKCSRVKDGLNLITSRISIENVHDLSLLQTFL